MLTNQVTRSASYVVCLLTAGLLATTPVAAAESMTLNSAINKSGRQRMLSQRMTKAYCQLGLHVHSDDAQIQLNDAVRLFERQLAELKGFAPTPQIGVALGDVESKWVPFKAIVAKPYHRDGASKLLELNEALLQAADRVVRLYQDHSGKPVGRLVNVSGRQRMLSQRLAKFYMLRELGFRQPSVLEGLKQVRTEFVSAQTELREAEQNTPEIRKYLDNVSVQWKLLDYSLMRDDGKLALFVVLTTDKILASMDAATGLYETLP